MDLHLIDQIGDFRSAVKDTAKSVGISGEPVLVHPEKDRQSLLDLMFGDVSPLAADAKRNCWISRRAFTIFGSRRAREIDDSGGGNRV